MRTGVNILAVEGPFYCSCWNACIFRNLVM